LPSAVYFSAEGISYELFEEVDMLIKSYGLFWEADEIDWTPGKGAKDTFRLLGRQGKNLPGLRVADFRYQHGIYVLYGNYGPHYVGLTRKQGLGKRIKDHREDDHAGQWNRFSWFGFRTVLKQTDACGLCTLKDLASVALSDPQVMIGDTEALLIKAMGLTNKADMNFAEAEEWEQVKSHEIDHYLRKFGSDTVKVM
jgi:hypothetical protein